MKRIGRFFQARRNVVLSGIRFNVGRARRVVRRGYALLCHRIYYVRYRLSRWAVRYGTVAVSVTLLLFVTLSLYLASALQDAVEPYFASGDRLDTLRSLFLTVGGALIGAAAIAFSLVMFAMQVNVERMPHGLFRKFSSDWRLLGAFASTFFLATAVASLSLIPETSWLAVAVLGAGWGTVLILILFLYAYRRALSLINPLQQLGLIVEDSRRNMRVWARRARRAAPLLEDSDATESEQLPQLRSTHDMARARYFQFNPHWTAGARQAITHAISFARRYAEQGDYEVSGAALTAVVGINATYVEAKGKTFFTNHLMFNNPLSTDGFINETLEHLRQNVRIGVSRGDERQIEQALQAIAALVELYLGIDYSTKRASRVHAHIAARYLSDAVQSVVPQNMAEVVMEGVRLMGQSARLFLAHAEPNEMVALAEKIGFVACAGIAKEDYRPITLIGVEQLARLTFDLIRTKADDIRFAAGALKKSVSLIAKLFLALPDTPLSSIHSTYLGPYYSGTSAQTLRGWLTELANALLKAEADDEAARTVIRHIEQWAEELHRTEKELCLTAVKRRSHFTFDIVHWIAHVTEILLAISGAPACDEHTRDKLRKYALWLVLVLSWVPDDKETVTFVENFEMTEILFGIAMDAHNRDCEKVSHAARDLLFSWAFKAGRHQTGWTILENSMCGLATLVLVTSDDEDGSTLKSAISERLAKEDAPNQETRDHAARGIQRRAAKLYREGRWSSRIESTMSQVDHKKLRPLLEDIANLLSPGTANTLVN